MPRVRVTGGAGGAGGGGVTDHALLTGLNTGDDHPQYLKEADIQAKGDLFVGTANDTVGILTTPSQRGQVLSADDVGNVGWEPMVPGPLGFCIGEEFVMLNTGFAVASNPNPVIGPFQGSLTGTAAAISPTAGQGANHQGVLFLDTGTTTTGRTYLGTGLTALTGGGGLLRCGQWVIIATASDGTNRFEVNAGFLDGFSTATIADGASFAYRDNLNSGKWLCTTSAASVTTATSTDSGITANAAQWYFLEVEINAAGTSVTYFIDKTLVATHAANVPTGANTFGYGISILKSLGTTARTVSIDAMRVKNIYTTAR